MIDKQTVTPADMTRMMHPYAMNVPFRELEQMRDDDELGKLRDDVKVKIAEARGINPEKIWLGSSTTAVSKFIFEHLMEKWQSVAGVGQEGLSMSPKALIPSPTYNGIVTQLEQIGWDVIEEEYAIPELYTPTYFESFLHRIRNEKPYVVVIANPNNPTGAFFTPENIELICAEVERYGGYVVVDEAYLRARDPDGQLSAVQLLQESSDKEEYTGEAFEAMCNLMVIESVQKNWPVHIMKVARKTPFSSDNDKLAVVYACEEIIEGLKVDIEEIKNQAFAEDDADAIETLMDLIPSKKGILLFQLAFLKPEYWQNMAYVLLNQINIVLHTLHEINELAQKQAMRDTAEREQHSPLLLPEESVSGVMVIGVLKSAVRRAMGVDEDDKTVPELLAESSVNVNTVFEDHPLSELYDMFRIVVQDGEQNRAFLLALADLILIRE